MTPEDTTRLRADAEAVRNAGARIVQTRDPGGPAYWAAHHDLREAKARLYLGAPPDSIILALLDEVERLQEALGLAYPRALQAAAGVVEGATGFRSPERREWLVDAILELTEEQIEAFAREVTP